MRGARTRAVLREGRNVSPCHFFRARGAARTIRMPQRCFLHFLGCFIALLVTFAPARSAHAGEGAAEAYALRPIRFASLELNAVAPVAGRIGGQLQVGLIGRLTIVASATHLQLKDTQYYSEYDEEVRGNPAVEGWTFELGPRLYLGKARPLDQARAAMPRVDWWLAVSGIGQFVKQGGIMTDDGGYPYPTTVGGSKNVQRNGVAFDLGVQFSAGPIYLLFGVGVSTILGESSELSTRGNWGILDTSPERGHTTPRFLSAFGAGI